MYKKLIKVILLALLVQATTAFSAITISVLTNDSFGNFVKPDGISRLDTSGVLKYGIFDQGAFDALTASQKLDVSFVNTTFNSFGQFNFDSSGNITQTGQPLSGGTSGDQLSVFVFQGNDFAIFSSTSALWDYPSDPGGATLNVVQIDVTFTGLGSVISGTPNSFQLIAGVPEPTHFVAALSILSLLFVMYKRRR